MEWLDCMRRCENGGARDTRNAIFSAAILVVLFALSTACVGGPPVAVRPGPFEPLEAGVGFLVVQIDSDVGIERLDLDGRAIVRDLQAGQHLWIIRLEEGSYRWTAARLAPRSVGSGRIETKRIKVLDQEEFEFDVEAGEVNYPGEIVVWLADPDDGIWGGVSFRNRNHSAMAVRKLSESHPELLAAHPLRYAGTRGDEFLQFYTRLRKARTESDTPMSGAK